MTSPVAALPQLEQTLITIGEMRCRDYSKSSQLEWLETNSLGSFASGTVSGANTRRYHGLLVASLHPPVDRFVTLSKLEETVLVGKQYFELSANQFPQTVSPKGHYFIQEFRLEPFPTWVYNVNGLLLEKVVFMLPGENTTVVRYRLLKPEEDRFAVLALRPFVAFRDYHSLASENDAIQRLPVREEPALLQLRPYDGLPALTLHHNAIGFTVRPDWYRQFEYVEELNRGLNFREDLFTHGYFSFELSSKNPVAFVVATLDDKGSISTQQVEAWESQEESRRRAIMTSPASDDPFVQQLQLAADAFVIRRADGASSIMAGYHWFTDWGRDTMISLPGLALTTGRFELAKNILSSFLKYCDQGMLPNRFPDRDGAPEFNTVDATLWLFHAVHQYFLATGDLEFLRDEAFPKLEEVIDWHLKGTRYGIRMDAADGLLAAGEPGVQLTWMDAKIGDWVVTPRPRKGSRDQCALAQCHVRDGKLQPQTQERGTRAFLSAAALGDSTKLQPSLLECRSQMPFRLYSGRSAGQEDSTQPDLRHKPSPPSPAFRQSPSRRAGGERETADAVRIAQPGAWRSRLPARVPRE